MNWPKAFYSKYGSRFSSIQIIWDPVICLELSLQPRIRISNLTEFPEFPIHIKVVFFLIQQIWHITLYKFKLYSVLHIVIWLLMWYLLHHMIVVQYYCLYSLSHALDLYCLFTTCYKFVLKHHHSLPVLSYLLVTTILLCFSPI